jgi:hypothetical protein
MKRAWIGAIGGALLVGMALPAAAQQPPAAAPPAFTVTFSGELRVAGIVYDNLRDFSDTGSGACAQSFTSARLNCKDSDSFLHERFRLFTTIQSADKKAKVVWGLEIGDLAFGEGGGAAGPDFGGSSTRVGPSSGAEVGNDGVNVETKHLYVQFDIPGAPTANLLLGLHNLVFLSGPAGAYFDDDGAGAQFNWRAEPLDLQAWYAKATENSRQDPDDNDLYALRFGVTPVKDIRFTVEGLAANLQCFARRAAAAGAVGTCVDSDFGDTFWVGGTFAGKFGDIQVDVTGVYGQRELFCTGPVCNGSAAPNGANIEESGYGLQATVRVPFGPIQTWFHGWYTSGDENRIVGSSDSATRIRQPGQDFSTVPNSTRLIADSDKLPMITNGASWLSVPFVAEELTGSRTTGNISKGQPLYDDPSGTYGVGGSAIYALTPAVSLGAGVGYVAATEDNGVFGDFAFEMDGGILYTVNANLSFQGVAGYIIPDQGDDAWSLIWRARFAF